MAVKPRFAARPEGAVSIGSPTWSAILALSNWQEAPLWMSGHPISRAKEHYACTILSLCRHCTNGQHLQSSVHLSQCRAERMFAPGHLLGGALCQGICILLKNTDSFTLVFLSSLQLSNPFQLRTTAPPSRPVQPLPGNTDQRYQAKLEYQDTIPPHKFRQRNYPFSCQWWDIFPGRLEKLGMQGAQTTTP